jgi:CheY-like chemotaxis protein
MNARSAEAMPREAEVPDNTGAERPGASGPPSVLIVEDEALIRMVTVDTLETLGFAVLEAGSAAEAVGKLGSGRHIDVALIDMGLPDRKGDVLVGELRALQPTLKIIIASGYSAANLRKRVTKDAITKLLAKPFDGRQLEAALKSLGLDAPVPTPL